MTSGGTRIAVCAGWLALVCAGPACTDESPCEEDARAVERCGRRYSEDVCSTREDRCITACFARATCNELDAVDADSAPAWLALCWGDCDERFACDDGTLIPDRWRCDGDQDCVGGEDEYDCEYFECGDGFLTKLEYRCDEWADCGDRSDEEACGYFLCFDNRMTVTIGERCNGRVDCADGSDERDCK